MRRLAPPFVLFFMANGGWPHVRRLSWREPLTRSDPVVAGRDGRIAYRAVPCREIAPTACEELGEVIQRLMPAEVQEP